MRPSLARSIINRGARPGPSSVSIVSPLFPMTRLRPAKTGGSPDVLDKLPLAHGGTLYLEGVQHLPRNSQRILAERLRVLR